MLAQENYTMVCGQKGITFLKDFTKFCACLTPQSIFVLLPTKIYLDLLAIFLKAKSQLSSNGQICKDNDHSGQPACTIKSNQIRSVHHRPLFSLSTSMWLGILVQGAHTGLVQVLLQRRQACSNATNGCSTVAFWALLLLQPNTYDAWQCCASSSYKSSFYKLYKYRSVHLARGNGILWQG